MRQCGRWVEACPPAPGVKCWALASNLAYSASTAVLRVALQDSWLSIDQVLFFFPRPTLTLVYVVWLLEDTLGIDPVVLTHSQL